jgi:hypothetical protein
MGVVTSEKVNTTAEVEAEDHVYSVVRISRLGFYGIVAESLVRSEMNFRVVVCPAAGVVQGVLFTEDDS